MNTTNKGARLNRKRFALPLLLLVTLGIGSCGIYTKSFKIGVTVSGLDGTVVLQNNGGDDLTISDDGFYNFATAVGGERLYNVTVLTQPAGQICTVSKGDGEVDGPIDDVLVNCTTNALGTFSISGIATGLTGTVVLQNNGADDLAVSANSGFTFPSLLNDGTIYSITVLTQPGGQTCSVSNSTGTVVGADVNNVTVICLDDTFTIGGTVSGLSGTAVLQNNGGGDLDISANGPFTFVAPLKEGETYDVTVLTQPTGQTCTVINGSGSAPGNDVDSVVVTCVRNAFNIGGTVGGLSGTVVLRNNGGNDLAISADGPFSFTAPIDNSSSYNVTVLTQPIGQTCTVSSGSGTVSGADVTSVRVICITNPPGTFGVGGAVSGLTSGGFLSLQINGGETLTVSANGNFTFATPIIDGAPYDITVFRQPGTQTCTISNGSGTISGASVTDVAVSCVTNTFSIGGTISGVNNTIIVLQNNLGDDLSVDTDGNFTFATRIEVGSAYNVTVFKPGGQNCTVGNGNGVVSGANVTDVVVNCVAMSFFIRGTVSGLNTAGLQLQNNGGDNLSVFVDGDIKFGTMVSDGSAYNVTVLTQPNGQTCTVGNGSGIVSGADVSNVAVSCVTDPFTVGGTVSGLSGTGLQLQNNGGDTLNISANGEFIFATVIANGNSYDVTVLTQPSNPSQTCSVADGSGTIGGSDVKTVSVTCSVGLTLEITAIKTFRFSWPDVTGATHYKVLENPDGMSGFTQVGGDIPQGKQRLDHIVPLYARVNAQYMLQFCDALGCSNASSVSVIDSMRSAIGYFKASNTETRDNFGGSVALSADGYTLAVGAAGEGSNATGIDGDQNDNSADRAGAVYVFTRDAVGVWAQQAYVKAFNTGAGDGFGGSVALSADGNTLAVGAGGEASSATGIDGDESDDSAVGAGAVYVFTRDGAGAWSQQAYIKASNAGANDLFGIPLDLADDGNTLAVAARQEDSTATGVGGAQGDSGLNFNSGAVYVFSRDGSSVWSQQAYVKASNTQANDRFGASVALAGDGATLAVGANLEDSGATGINGNQNQDIAGQAGAVYVFTVDGSGVWSQQAYVKASNTDDGDQFGTSVALSVDGNTLAATATREASSATGVDGDQSDNSAFGGAGAVYVFDRNSNSVWSQQAYIKASNPEGNDWLGNSVTLSADGNTLAVGASGERSLATGINGDQSSNTATRAGAVYVFIRDGGSWSQQAYVKSSNTATFVDFSNDIALAGDGNTLAIGAFGEHGGATGIDGDQNNSSAGQSGAVYLY